MFITLALSVWAVMHAFVFWRLCSVPWIAAHFSRQTIWLTAFALWVSFPLARILETTKAGQLAIPLEIAASTWVGILFLLLCALLVVEVGTAGGWLFRKAAPALRGWAAVVGLMLSVIALSQGLRQPVIRNHEITLEALPPERDGLVIAHASDLHLGTSIGQRWLRKQVERINFLEPDIIVLVGDIVDGNAVRVEPLVPVLGQLRAPLGVFAVTGNHEYYAGVDQSVALFERAGLTVLRNRTITAAPGLAIAGVDDLSVRKQFGMRDDPLGSALNQATAGATILLSHSPVQTKRAAGLGVDLMLCGHTHNGQIWPFNYIVALRYPMIAGLYMAGSMQVLVSRGAGTWGPRMRLWKPGEILRITLRSGAAPLQTTTPHQASSPLPN